MPLASLDLNLDAVEIINEAARQVQGTCHSDGRPRNY